MPATPASLLEEDPVAYAATYAVPPPVPPILSEEQLTCIYSDVVCRTTKKGVVQQRQRSSEIVPARAASGRVHHELQQMGRMFMQQHFEQQMGRHFTGLRMCGPTVDAHGATQPKRSITIGEDMWEPMDRSSGMLEGMLKDVPAPMD